MLFIVLDGLLPAMKYRMGTNCFVTDRIYNIGCN